MTFNVSFYTNPIPSMTNPPVPVADEQALSQTLDEKILEALQIIQARGI